jgi:hypothetical protein
MKEKSAHIKKFGSTFRPGQGTGEEDSEQNKILLSGIIIPVIHGDSGDA